MTVPSIAAAPLSLGGGGALVWHSWAIKVGHHQEIVSLTQGEHRSGFRYCTCERAGGWSLRSSGTSTTVVMPIKLVTTVTTSWLIVQGVISHWVVKVTLTAIVEMLWILHQLLLTLMIVCFLPTNLEHQLVMHCLCVAGECVGWGIYPPTLGLLSTKDWRVSRN